MPPLASALVTAMMSISAGAVVGPQPQQNTAAVVRSQDDAAGTSGEDGSGGFFGLVLSSSGEMIPGAIVTLINEATGELQVGDSGDMGAFRFTSLKPGSYALKFDRIGFESIVKTGVVAHANRRQHFNVTMPSIILEPTLNLPAQEQTEIATRSLPMPLPVLELVGVGGVAALPVRPLRDLYSRSDRIVVARVGDSKQVDREGESSLYRTPLIVSSTIKGRHKPIVYVYSWVFQNEPGEFKAGDTFLVFLNRRKTDYGEKVKGGYEVEDTRYGIKKLPDGDLQVYLNRIEELKLIVNQAKPKTEDIVEWLVRCAEDPATRWEGAYELLTSEEALEALKQPCVPPSADALSAAEATLVEQQVARVALSGDLPDQFTARSSTAADSATLSQNANSPPPEPDRDDAGETPIFAASLTWPQRARLVSAVLKTETVNERDAELMRLVMKWNEPRLLTFILSQLHKMEGKPARLAEDLVEMVAELMDDERISSLAQDYRDNVSYEDEEPELADEPDMSDREQHVEEAEQDAEDLDEEDVYQPRSPFEAVQNRMELLRKFLKAVDVRLVERTASTRPR